MSTIASIVPKPVRRALHEVSDSIERRRRRRVPIPWGSWARLRHYGDLRQAVRGVWDYTMVPGRRLANLYYAVLLSQDVEGDIVECGVCNGGSAALLGYAARVSGVRRQMYLFDSFQGLPKPTEEDGARAEGWEGKCFGQVDRVKAALRGMGVDLADVHIFPGWFHETFPTAPVGKIAVLHIDADFYEPVKLCLETFYDRVTPGGAILFDDYNIWEGCDRAAHEFFSQRGLQSCQRELAATGHYFRKPTR